MMTDIGCLIIALLVGYIIFAVIIFPLLVMTLFAIPIIFPYVLGAAALYFVWKFLKKRA